MILIDYSLMLKSLKIVFLCKAKDVMNKGIFKQTLWNIKKRTRKNEMKYKTKNAIRIYLCKRF